MLVAGVGMLLLSPLVGPEGRARRAAPRPAARAASPPGRAGGPAGTDAAPRPRTIRSRRPAAARRPWARERAAGPPERRAGAVRRADRGRGRGPSERTAPHGRRPPHRGLGGVRFGGGPDQRPLRLVRAFLNLPVISGDVLIMRPTPAPVQHRAGPAIQRPRWTPARWRSTTSRSPSWPSGRGDRRRGTAAAADAQRGRADRRALPAPRRGQRPAWSRSGGASSTRPARAPPPGRATRNGAVVAVNVSARQLADPSLPTGSRRCSSATACAPTCSLLDVPEYVVAEAALDGGPILEHLRDLAGLGVRIAVDDVGTGAGQPHLPLDRPGLDASRSTAASCAGCATPARPTSPRRSSRSPTGSASPRSPRASSRPRRPRRCAPSAATSARATRSAAPRRPTTSPDQLRA